MSQFLQPEEIQALKRMHKISDRRKADKIKAILMLNSGYNSEEIAQILLLDDSTIRRWYSIYKLKANKSEHDRIWFMDAVHPLHNSQPAYLLPLNENAKQFSFRGSNTERNSIYFLPLSGL